MNEQLKLDPGRHDELITKAFVLGFSIYQRQPQSVKDVAVEMVEICLMSDDQQEKDRAIHTLVEILFPSPPIDLG